MTASTQNCRTCVVSVALWLFIINYYKLLVCPNKAQTIILKRKFMVNIGDAGFLFSGICIE